MPRRSAGFLPVIRVAGDLQTKRQAVPDAMLRNRSLKRNSENAKGLLAVLVALAALVLTAVLIGSLMIVPFADAPAPIEGASAVLYRHVIAGCLIVIGAGTPWLASFGNARGLMLLMCFAAVGGVGLIWRRTGLRWLAAVAATAVLIGELA